MAERGAIVALHDKKEIEIWPEPARSLKETHKIGLISSDRPGRYFTWCPDEYDPRPIR